MKGLYPMVLQFKMFFISQPELRSFSDAVLYAEPFASNEPFLLHAADDIILSHDYDHSKRLIKAFEKYDADATVLMEEVEDPRA